MANPTTNFGWQMPQNTDLVKDLPADFEVFGQAVDTDLADLKGGTTGQNLRKATNTDLDFTWAGDATNTVVDAAGDLLYGTAADTLGRLAIGTANQVLAVNSGATAPEWKTISTGGMTELASGSLSGSTVTLSSISGSYRDLILIVNAPSLTSGSGVLTHRFNNNSTSQSYKMNINYANLSDGQSYSELSNTTFIRYCGGTADIAGSADPAFAYLRLRNYTNTTTYKQFDGFFYSAQASRFGSFSGAQTDLSASAINEITITTSASTFDVGTYILYGVS